MCGQTSWLETAPIHSRKRNNFTSNISCQIPFLNQRLWRGGHRKVPQSEHDAQLQGIDPEWQVSISPHLSSARAQVKALIKRDNLIPDNDLGKRLYPARPDQS